MYANSIRKFDDKTVYSFLTSRPVEVNRKSYFDYYNEYGGYSSIDELLEECEKIRAMMTIISQKYKSMKV